MSAGHEDGLSSWRAALPVILVVFVATGWWLGLWQGVAQALGPGGGGMAGGRGMNPAGTSPVAPLVARDLLTASDRPLPDDAVRTVGTRALEVATFAAGCFWSTESNFDAVPGVVSTTSGYAGGQVANPTYRAVSTGGTGHVETVEVLFDPGVVSYDALLERYWRTIDPFNDHGQFCDYGEQYRPVLFVHDARQRDAAERSRSRVQADLGRSVVVPVVSAGPFYAAEAEHQDFHNRNVLRYQSYRWGCGRAARLREVWGDAAGERDIIPATPARP